MLRFLTAGESHGRMLVVIVDGLPAGLPVDAGAFTRDLRRRQQGHGRGRRMAIETDTAVVVGGVRHGRTTGAPVAVTIENRDWANWAFTMHAEETPPQDAGGSRRAPVTRPRPGHADLAGAIKYGHADIRDVLERASARETAARVAAGALARRLLSLCRIEVASHVVAIGPERSDAGGVSFDRIAALPDDSPTRCVDEAASARMIAAIDAAGMAGDTLGGVFEVAACGVPAGLGSYAQWDRRLDGRLAQALMSIPAIKAVSIGIGAEAAHLRGSQVHDEILPPPAAGGGRQSPLPVVRPTNHAGGLEGGVTNGQELRVSASMKPIATLMTPLRSIDLESGTDAAAAIERSDVCAVPAAAIVGEAMVALVLADAFLERFGGDSVDEVRHRYAEWQRQVEERFTRPRQESASS
jgi:chorismate synthase